MKTLMTELVIIKLDQLVTKKWFDITLLTSLISMLGGEMTAEENKMLGYMHCVQFDGLSATARAELAQYIFTILKRYVPEFDLNRSTLRRIGA